VPRRKKPKLAVWKFASCDGCQLSLLDCEDELLAVAGAVQIAYFPEASRAVVRGPYDLSLVEGSVTTPHDAERIHEVRRASKRLVTIGACATAGGIQALRNFADVGEYLSAVYARPEYIRTLQMSTPIADHVKVDFELRGCPVNKMQLVEVIAAFLADRRPNTPPSSVCIECKQRGTVCWLRGYLPRLPPRLLRLLRADGNAEHRIAQRPTAATGHEARRRRSHLSHLQRLGRAVPHCEHCP